MDRDAIPEAVRRLIAAHIDSVPQLEALLLLRSEPAREWNAASVAARLYVAESAAHALLVDLSERGFLSPSAPPNARYCVSFRQACMRGAAPFE